MTAIPEIKFLASGRPLAELPEEIEDFVRSLIPSDALLDGVSYWPSSDMDFIRVKISYRRPAGDAIETVEVLKRVRRQAEK